MEAAVLDGSGKVHTTGTDTKQPLQSYAALTLSASMTFRDYAPFGCQGWASVGGLTKRALLGLLSTPGDPERWP